MQQPSSSNRLRPFRPTPFGRYTLLMPLSVGGMGEIFLARLEGAQGFEKLCVIKKILPHLAQDADFVTRFVNEARTLVKLTHGSIAQVLDMGLHQGEPYLALEYIDGKDLRKVGARCRERGMPLPLTFVLYVMGRVLDALAYAHRKRDDDDHEIGLVHRDVSPQNILISYEGEVKVIDFGLAKSTLNASKTNPSIVLGKFLYMSPEQAHHANVDRRSDLYSVGLCLYELIAGKNPFEGIPQHALMAAVASPSIAHVQEVEPLCPTNVANIIMKALAVDPAQRFQTAEELRGKLLSTLLEIDPNAGPESCSRFMRDMFGAEYQTERRLLSQLREAARLDSKPEVPTAQVRALHVARSTPRIETGPGDEPTPSPTDLRRYGLEPTMPGTSRGAPEARGLSFAPTPKLGGSPHTPAGERETMPGIVFDRAASPTLQTTYPALDPVDDESAVGATTGPELFDSAPTRPVALNVSRQAMMPTPQSLEPVTSEIDVVQGPSQEDLPSVMVNGIAAQTLLPRAPGSRSPGVRPQVSEVLVPASSVRAPQVVAPLPRALEGQDRPEAGTLTTDRTRRRRRGGLLVALPILAILAVVAFFGFREFRDRWVPEWLESEAALPTHTPPGKLEPGDHTRKAAPAVAPSPENEAPVAPTSEEQRDDGDAESDQLAPLPPAPQHTVAPAPVVAAPAPARAARAAAPSKAQQCWDRLKSRSGEGKRLPARSRDLYEALRGQMKSGLTPSAEATFLEQCEKLTQKIR